MFWARLGSETCGGIRRELLARVVAAIAAAALAPEDERRVLLQLQAHGATAVVRP